MLSVQVSRHIYLKHAKKNAVFLYLSDFIGCEQNDNY